MTYIGISILGLLAFLIVIGLLNTAFRRMNVRRGLAFLLTISLIAGIILPSIAIGATFSFSISALILFGVSLYLIIAGAMKGEWRCLPSILVTTVALFFLMYFIPVHYTAIAVVLAIAVGLIAGAISYLFARSSRGAFPSAVMGILLAQLLVFIVNVSRGVRSPLALGTGWMFDSLILAALTALLLAEFSAGLAYDRRHVSKTVKTKQGILTETSEFHDFD